MLVKNQNPVNNEIDLSMIEKLFQNLTDEDQKLCKKIIILVTF